ncbi:hypothetical protein [Saccharopolyspora gloriosae]|uniref:hypothetical protein n=1 Tax=Saccharopolyspora gloriosae TaxID=455344 RepID=UPI001FB6F6F9|nr:hypothetical protein [Saccharopolyspora gloriosae]
MSTDVTARHRESPHPLDAFVNDPTGRPPLGDERLFSEIMAGIVADTAPRVFAVVQEYGDRVDGRVAAWGLALDDRAVVVPVDRRGFTTAPTAGHVLRQYRFGTHIRPRIVWYDPANATPEVDDESGSPLTGD